MVERRTRIREKRNRSIIPVEIARPASSTPAQRPAILTFRYGQRLVVCEPTWSDLGRLVALRFDCPNCLAETFTVIDSPEGFRLSSRTGRFSVHGCLRCFAGCDLHLHIDDGRAIRWPAMFLCAR